MARRGDEEARRGVAFVIYILETSKRTLFLCLFRELADQRRGGRRGTTYCHIAWKSYKESGRPFIFFLVQNGRGGRGLFKAFPTLMGIE